MNDYSESLIKDILPCYQTQMCKAKDARDGFLLKKIGSKIEYLELNSSPHQTKAYIYLGGASKSTHTE